MRPRAAFVGTGWIGRHRMAALVDGDLVEPIAICDPDPACRTAAAQIAPLAPQFDDFDAALAEQPDAVVIATPSALHADQAKAALEAGIPVFCQKPLGRSAE
ncbi:MAG: Gfo/Idh/MocA family oxidoreductase, partial [Sphingomonadales bacterium]|nr:Gfo/Idh/MocA family oxidoreductase [Sphingomonadales bacterium]